MIRFSDRCSGASPLLLEAANPRDQTGRRGWPCVHSSKCAVTLSDIIQVQAGLKGPHRSHRQEWWHILLHDSETDHSVVSGQSDWHVGAHGRCRTSCTARRLWFLLAPFWRPCSASRFPHRSSCWRPITPSLAPVPHRTSPGSSATSVQLAPKKNGRRLVVPVTAVNPLGPPSGSLHVDHTSRRCIVLDVPLGTREPILRHLAHLRRRASAAPYSSASYPVPALGHLRHVEGRRTLEPSVRR